MALSSSDIADCFPSQTAMDIQILPTPKKVPESVKLHCTPFECFISKSKNKMRYIRTTAKKDLVFTHFEYTFKKMETEWKQKYRNGDYELKMHKWRNIHNRYSSFVTCEDNYTRMEYDKKRLSVTQCFVCENMYLVKPQFTFGLRIVGDQERHIIQTFHAPMFYYVSRSKQTLSAPERQFRWTNHHLYQPYELKPFTVYCVPPGMRYILLACDYTLFALQRVHESVALPSNVSDPLTHSIVQIREGVGKSVLAEKRDKGSYFGGGGPIKKNTTPMTVGKKHDSIKSVSEKISKNRDRKSSSSSFKTPSDKNCSKSYPSSKKHHNSRESSVMPFDRKPSFYNQSTKSLGGYKIPKLNSLPPPPPLPAPKTCCETEKPLLPCCETDAPPSKIIEKNPEEEKLKEILLEKYLKFESFNMYDQSTQTTYCWKCEIVTPVCEPCQEEPQKAIEFLEKQVPVQQPETPEPVQFPQLEQTPVESQVSLQEKQMAVLEQPYQFMEEQEVVQYFMQQAPYQFPDEQSVVQYLKQMSTPVQSLDQQQTAPQQQTNNEMLTFDSTYDSLLFDSNMNLMDWDKPFNDFTTIPMDYSSQNEMEELDKITYDYFNSITVN